MTLANFTSPGLVIPRLRGGEATSVLKELAQLLGTENRVPDVLPFYQTVLNREFMVSRDWEASMAFPHARVAGIKHVSFALGRSDKPLRWGANTARGVRLVFLLAVPATDATQYLLLMSGLLRLSKEAALVAQLLAADDPLQMLEVLQQVALRAVPASVSPLNDVN
jgi:mannitol/fructose-specific phosphotransferase system IIA component (Ntr-type)